jgi:hypothetical protein
MVVIVHWAAFLDAFERLNGAFQDLQAIEKLTVGLFELCLFSVIGCRLDPLRCSHPRLITPRVYEHTP